MKDNFLVDKWTILIMVYVCQYTQTQAILIPDRLEVSGIVR